MIICETTCRLMVKNVLEWRLRDETAAHLEGEIEHHGLRSTKSRHETRTRPCIVLVSWRDFVDHRGVVQKIVSDVRQHRCDEPRSATACSGGTESCKQEKSEGDSGGNRELRTSQEKP